jgi:lipoprotein signal peptidase
MAERSCRKLFWGLAAAGLVADQVSKYGVFRWLYNGGQGQDYPVVTGAFDLLTRYSGEPGSGVLRTWSGPLLPAVNAGALFGKQLPAWVVQWLGGTSELWSNRFFAAISLVAAVAIVWWSSRPSARHERGLSAALGLILAGTLGNLYDRLVFGGVRDFLHAYYQSFDWPVFNVADCCLVIGAFLLLAQAFLGKAPVHAPNPPAPKQEMAEAR